MSMSVSPPRFVGVPLLEPVELNALGEAERAAITRVLEETRGHQVHAAEKLGISRRTLQRRIKSFGLKVEREVSVRV